MVSEESIYDLIPRARLPPPKQPRYVSKHSAEVDPKAVGGTLGVQRKPAATFGLPSEVVKPDPKRFLRTHEKEPMLPDPAPPSKPKDRVKPPVPSRADKPVLGLTSGKNYITVNAIEAILSKPGNVPQEEMQWTQKPDFGKVPTYLQRNRKQIEEEKKKVDEYRTLQKQRELAEAGVIREIPQGEREELLRHLKLKWASVNAAYQKLTFTLDTPAKQKRKEEYERQLTEIERYIRTLDKGDVLLLVEDE